MLELIEQICHLNGCGRLMVPFYRQLLPPFRHSNQSKISTDISQTSKDKYWNKVDRILNVLEQTGGPTAYINIKYILPHYQSCLQH